MGKLGVAMHRRHFLRSAGAAAVTQSALSLLARETAEQRPAQQFSLRIQPVSVELAPGVTIKTVGYNGQAPGPILRMREGVPVQVDVKNESGSPELVHWHGLKVGSLPDGAAEEGSPTIQPGGALRYSFVPEPAGTRWYHTHTMARTNLDLATYSGQYGFLMIEPRSHAGAYDREVFLAVHHWKPALMRMQEGPEECIGVGYQYASLNDRLLGAGEPIRVRQGERILFHFLNASATEDVMLALPGHRFKVLALDGNAVPNPASVEVLSLAVAERIDAVVEMNAPGVWVLGSLKEQERRIGLGAVVEYANHAGKPQWTAPKEVDWSYLKFGRYGHDDMAGFQRENPDGLFTMVFEKKSSGSGTDRWTINGQSYGELAPLRVRQGCRYRFRFVNASGCAHPVHLHRHSFELKRVGQVPTTGIVKDTLNLGRYNVAEAEFVADNPGSTLFHCHQQLHMDFGFMQLIRYS
jgi:FtsP/CotA-like multicopper oxidase with cupredoxin domain